MMLRGEKRKAHIFYFYYFTYTKKINVAKKKKKKEIETTQGATAVTIAESTTSLEHTSIILI